MHKRPINKDEYFVIPNPIYDVVFKYLMEDTESAIIVLSTLIGEEIISLEFEPLSYTHKISDIENDREITLFHLDFKAVIKLPNGETELIQIELQKAKLPNDIFRFKRYIAKNFQEKRQEEVIDRKTKALKTIEKPIRLIPIFILNFRIENEINDLLIKTNRVNRGIFKEKSLTKSNDFIDHLTYDIWVVQLPNLALIEQCDYENDEYKKKLYFLLKLFDQDAQMENRHRLLLIRKLFPGYLKRVIKRLKSAASENPDLEEEMMVEDEYLKVLEDHANERSQYKQLISKQKKQLEKQNKALKEQGEVLKQKNEALKNMALTLAKTLKKTGVAITIIQQQTGLSMEEIEGL